MRRLTILSVGGLVVLAWVALNTRPGPAPAHAQQPKAGETNTAKRIIYSLKYRAAKDLAEVVGKHFKAEPDVQVLAEPGSNFLLISAPPAALTEMVKLLDQLDRRPETVVIDVLVVEPAVAKGAAPKGVAEKELEDRDLTGTIDQIANKVHALRKGGLLGDLKHFQLTTLDNQAASVRVGGSRPYVTGRQLTPRGGSNVINYRDAGTIMTATPRVVSDQQIVLDLRLEDSRMVVPEDGVQLGTDDNGKPIRATEFVTSTLNSKLTLTPSRALLAEDVKTQAKSAQARTLVIVSARVVQPDAKPEK